MRVYDRICNYARVTKKRKTLSRITIQSFELTATLWVRHISDVTK